VNPYGCACPRFTRGPRLPDAPHRRWDTWTNADRGAVLEARAAGVTLRELGARFGGISVERMRQVVVKSERLRAAGRLPERLHDATIVDSG